MQIDPKYSFWFGVYTSILLGLATGAVNLPSTIPHELAAQITGWCAFFGWINSVILTALNGYSSNKSGPLTSIAPPAPTTVVKVLIAAFALSFLLAGSPASAQGRIRPLTGDVAKDFNLKPTTSSTGGEATVQGSAIGDTGCKVTGDGIADLRCVLKAGGGKLVLHLKQSYALASAKAANGSVADNTSAMCTKALVPIVELVVNGPPSGTVPDSDPMALTADEQKAAADTNESEGAIVVVEKMRILRLALQSPALNDACGALVQDEVKNAQNIIGKVTSLITGAGLTGLTGIPVIP